jgi:hypothetical protein
VAASCRLGDYTLRSETVPAESVRYLNGNRFRQPGGTCDGEVYRGVTTVGRMVVERRRGIPSVGVAERHMDEIGTAW